VKDPTASNARSALRQCRRQHQWCGGTAQNPIRSTVALKNEGWIHTLAPAAVRWRVDAVDAAHCAFSGGWRECSKATAAARGVIAALETGPAASPFRGCLHARVLTPMGIADRSRQSGLDRSPSAGGRSALECWWCSGAWGESCRPACLSKHWPSLAETTSWGFVDPSRHSCLF
jgi:hypothetical protein